MEYFSNSYLPPVGDLSSQLLTHYRLLDEKERSMFRQIYRSMFDYLLPVASFAREVNVLAYYFVVPDIIKRFNLKPKDISILSLFWLLSGGGKKAFNTSTFKFKRWQQQTIKKFVELGYIRRSYFDPINPHSIRILHASWIYFTGEGVLYYRDVLNAFRKAIISFHGSEWFGDKK